MANIVIIESLYSIAFAFTTLNTHSLNEHQSYVNPNAFVLQVVANIK